MPLAEERKRESQERFTTQKLPNLDPGGNSSSVKMNVRKKISLGKSPRTLEKLTFWPEPSNSGVKGPDKIVSSGPKRAPLLSETRIWAKTLTCKNPNKGNLPSPRQGYKKSRGEGRPNYAMLPLLYIMRQVKGREEEDRPSCRDRKDGRKRRRGKSERRRQEEEEEENGE